MGGGERREEGGEEEREEDGEGDNRETEAEYISTTTFSP